MPLGSFFDKLVPYLAGLGTSLINLDADSVGVDDAVGQGLLYGASVIQAVESGQDLPPLPDILLTPIQGKVSGPARTAIILASGVLAVAEFQLAAGHPKASRALHYIGQVLAALSAGKPVPAPPTL